MNNSELYNKYQQRLTQIVLADVVRLYLSKTDRKSVV